jgi:uncharacterized protein YndB with AHSA1/START domain
MTTRSALHDTFRLDRHFSATTDRVFRAFADPQAKAKWFGGPGVTKSESFEFSEGGRETLVAEMADGNEFGYFVTYQDIVPGERIVYTYEMSLNGKRISVSVATVELRAAAGGGTDFTLTEQGVYLDGLDSPDQRRQGTEQLLDALEKSL